MKPFFGLVAGLAMMVAGLVGVAGAQTGGGTGCGTACRLVLCWDEANQLYIPCCEQCLCLCVCVRVGTGGNYSCLCTTDC